MDRIVLHNSNCGNLTMLSRSKTKLPLNHLDLFFSKSDSDSLYIHINSTFPEGKL